MGIVDEDIERVRAAVPLVEVVQQYVGLRRVGVRWVGLCPFHAEKTPSFGVNESLGIYKCLAGETGVITWDGVRPIRELAGTTQRVLIADGRWGDAEFKSFGVQPLVEVKLTRNRVEKVIHATAEHRWFTAAGAERETQQLVAGDVLASAFAPQAVRVLQSVGGRAQGFSARIVAESAASRAENAIRAENRGTRWTVRSVLPTERLEEVYCAVVPTTRAFALEDNILTGNCFGCGVGGDVISFVREIEHLDFVGAVELLANKAGIQLRYTSGGEGRDRQRRQVLLDAMAKAVDWYNQRLLESPDARPARDYLRARGITGEAARQFRIGWAPDDWDALVQALRLPNDVVRATGLAFVNRRDRLQDSFRARVMFPIFNESGDAVAFGGRVLPGSDDPAKYKNSPETRVYAKSKTLYGLNWAKAGIVAADQVVVCEGYTDVIGFHQAGVPRAVATCGTALTEDHVRLLKRFAGRMVLAFDADEAGQGAAARFYEWERKYGIEVSVARLPAGKDPGELAQSDPAALRAAVDGALPFLGFRLERELRAGSIDTPERRARLAERAMAVVGEHPDVNIRKIYAGQVASHCGLPVADLVALAERGGRNVRVPVAAPRPSPKESAEAVALALLVHRWDDIAPWLVESLFADELHLAAFRALADAHGDARKAMELADPATRELLERLAVTDVDEDPDRHARHLIAVAARRRLDGMRSDFSQAREHARWKVLVEQLDDPEAGPAAAEQLLTWLDRRTEERA